MFMRVMENGVSSTVASDVLGKTHVLHEEGPRQEDDVLLWRIAEASRHTNG